MAPLITNKNSQPEGFSFGSQTPADDRLIFTDNADLISLGVGNQNAYKYYEGMVVTQVDTLQTFIWAEASTGALGTSFTYPAGHSVNGVNYGTRAFNFVDITSSANTGVGDIYFVGNDGDDSTAVKGNTTRAWQNITTAKAAAIASGDPNTLIYVFPGSYQEVNLAYEGGTYYFAPGATVQTNSVPHADRDQNVIFRSLLSEGDTVSNFSVYGEGDFYANVASDSVDTGGGVVYIDQPSFEGDFNFNSIICEHDTGIAVFNIARATIKGEYMYTMAGGYCITIRGTGSIEIEIDRIRSDAFSAILVRQSAVKYTGNLHLRTKYLLMTAGSTAIDFSQVVSPAQITINAMHVECTDAGGIGVKSVQQEGGEINVNIQKLKTEGTGIYSYLNVVGGDFRVNIEQAICGTGGEGIIVRDCSKVHRTYVNAERYSSSHTNACVSLTQGNTDNQIKLDGTFLSLDAGATTIDMSSTNSSSALVVGTATFLSNGTNSIKNTHATVKELRVNHSLSSNKPPVSGDIITTVTGTPFVIDSNIAR